MGDGFTVIFCVLLGLAMVVYAAVAPNGPKHTLLILVFLLILIVIAVIAGVHP